MASERITGKRWLLVIALSAVLGVGISLGALSLVAALYGKISLALTWRPHVTPTAEGATISNSLDLTFWHGWVEITWWRTKQTTVFGTPAPAAPVTEWLGILRYNGNDNTFFRVSELGCQAAVVAGPSVLIPGLLLLRAWRRHRRMCRVGYCRACGYDLTGKISGRCPECGAAANHSAARERGVSG